MRLITMKCPHCASMLNVDADLKKAKCDFCGTTILIDDEATHVHYDNAEEAGYKFEMGRQRAQAEMMHRQMQNQWNGRAPQQPMYNAQYNAPYAAPPKKRNTWLWVLGWIFFFPVPLTVLIARKKDWPPVVRYGLIALLWIVVIAIGATGESSGT